MAEAKNVAYKYNNIPIHAGGYVTGFCFHSKEEGRMYIRTDIGGVYRYNKNKDVFESLAAAGNDVFRMADACECPCAVESFIIEYRVAVVEVHAHDPVCTDALAQGNQSLWQG